MIGPSTSEQWMYWRYAKDNQVQRRSAKDEMEKILKLERNHKPALGIDEVTVIRKNLQSRGIDVDNELIRETWHFVYRRHFLRKLLNKAADCRGRFHVYQQGLESERKFDKFKKNWKNSSKH